MTFHDYLLQNLEHTAMITLTVDKAEPIQYNYWNWLHETGQFHLLRDDLSLGHILHGGSISVNEDGSANYTSSKHPKSCVLNFYFGSFKQ